MTVHWVRITNVNNIPLREGRAVLIGDRELALFNLGDRFLATDNRCPHQGGPLCDGIVTGSSVVCPLHAWKVNLASGRVERSAHGKDHCVATYPTRVEDGVVVVGIPALRGAGSATTDASVCAAGSGPAVSSVRGADSGTAAYSVCGAGSAPAIERADPPTGEVAA